MSDDSTAESLDAFAEATSEFLRLHRGTTEAVSVTLDVLIATLLKSLPPLAEPLAENLAAMAAVHRRSLEDPDNLRMFDAKIEHFQTVIRVMSAQG